MARKLVLAGYLTVTSYNLFQYLQTLRRTGLSFDVFPSLPCLCLDKVRKLPVRLRLTLKIIFSALTLESAICLCLGVWGRLAIARLAVLTYPT